MNQTSPQAWEALGLDAVDRSVYVALLSGAGEVSALAEQTGLTPGPIEASLARLRALGLVGSGADGRVVAGRPLLTMRRAAARLQVLVGDLLAESAELQVLHDRAHAPGRSQPDVRLLGTLEEVQQVFAELLAAAEHEVLACVAPPFLATGDFSDDEHEQLGRGVSYRVVYGTEAVQALGGVEVLSSFVQAGEQARVTDAVPLKMFLVDGRHALLPMAATELEPAGPPSEGAVLVTGPSLVAALSALFESVWERAWDLGDQPLPPGLDVDERDRRIIAALRVGATDEAIARQVGVTPRTVGRRLARLLELTGATTRFQLGWRLAVLTGSAGAVPHAGGSPPDSPATGQPSAGNGTDAGR